MNRLSRLIGVTCFLFCTAHLSAQTDTVRTELGKVETRGTVARADSASSTKSEKAHSPKRAALYSAVIPGLGQAYNQKYWKIPVLYAGVAGIGYAINRTNHNYQTFRVAYRQRLDGDTTYANYSIAQLKQSRDYWHRYRDLSIVGAVALYTIQVIDATVDAHLYKFDEKLSEDLTLEVRPRPFMGMMNDKPVTGLCFRLKF